MPSQKIISLFLILTLQFSANIVRCQAPCYLSSSFPLPRDVIAPPEVTCDNTNIFANIPDVIFNGLRFSQINFQTSGVAQGLTPLGYAIATFSAGNQNPEFIQTAGKLYTAVNAALRSRGERDILKQLKVVDFFIASQNDAIKGPDGKSGQLRNLKKVRKNCSKANCTGLELKTIKLKIKELETV
ncbi:hypothetical protein PGT21_016169 [Puccinia graminis f. sp. tritici]|uniref:DUF7143 domain-containing protein n=1 Tax=Puccinia graminis f. sp. tritici TaxID=56615 RepID=A0A5B0NV45_PUCGR|nr:hypothetical protein PGTUg99_010484 [Puccinia graminis f. sp. tritici]KAA1092853.1 hypothetical protein PGT21_016169 [Puccinia graminis f. sp. tritici]